MLCEVLTTVSLGEDVRVAAGVALKAHIDSHFAYIPQPVIEQLREPLTQAFISQQTPGKARN